MTFAFRITITALLALTLSGCGWFRQDLPVRNGPQAEHHVTYADCVDIEGAGPC